MTGLTHQRLEGTMEYQDSRETLANIATLYYLADMSQDEIANMYQISRFKVSRALRKCKAMKIVEFHINNQPSHYKKLEKQIEETFALKQVILVRPGSTLEESKDNVGRAAARFLMDNLKNGMYVGFSWGTTIQHIVPHFMPQRKYENLTFLQYSGNICSTSSRMPNYMDGTDIVRLMAQKAGADWSIYQVPHIVRSRELMELLQKEASIAEHAAKFELMDIAVVGLGTSIPEKCIEYISGFITLDEAKKLYDDGMGADICGIRINARGEMLPTILTDRVFTVGLNTLKKTPVSVALAAGSEKALSLIAGARGGYFNSIIIDEIAAFSMLNLAKCI